MKCGFAIQDAGLEACPQCGVVFAKLQKAMAEEAAHKRRLAAERSISATIEKRMEADEEVRSKLSFEADIEYERDESAYPVIRFLSGFFAFLAAFTAVVEALGLFHFYHWGKMIFGQQELLLFMVSLALVSVGSVVGLLAISEGLRMGRDVANNTRAMREYLRRMAGS